MTEIKRENSPYGNMKWKLTIFFTAGKSVQYFKTEKEAIYAEQRFAQRDHDKYCVSTKEKLNN